jgi:hypothetical protein
MYPVMKMICVIFGLLAVAFTEVLGADWIFYAKSEFGSYHYDAGNISRSSEQCVRVWQKLVLNDKGTVNLVEKLGKEYAQVTEAIVLREIDCMGKKSQILELTFHSEDGRVIKKESYEVVGWDSITPDSVDEFLHLAVCK